MYFIVNPLLTDAIDVPAVWEVLDVLMVVALAIALACNYTRKREECGGDPGGAVTRRYLEVNVAFYLTAAVTILFFTQLVLSAGRGHRQPGRQPPGLDNLGRGGRDPAAHRGHHWLPSVARDVDRVVGEG